jgi:hypothetical protein
LVASVAAVPQQLAAPAHTKFALWCAAWRSPRIRVGFAQHRLDLVEGALARTIKLDPEDQIDLGEINGDPVADPALTAIAATEMAVYVFHRRAFPDAGAARQRGPAISPGTGPGG